MSAYFGEKGDEHLVNGTVYCQRHQGHIPQFSKEVRVCSACVQDGTIPIERANGTWKDPDAEAAEAEHRAAVEEILRDEAEKEQLRRDSIDAAIEAGDVEAVVRLGGGKAGVRDAQAARALLAQATGDRVRHEDDRREEPARSDREETAERTPVGPVRESTDEGTGHPTRLIPPEDPVDTTRVGNPQGLRPPVDGAGDRDRGSPADEYLRLALGHRP